MPQIVRLFLAMVVVFSMDLRINDPLAHAQHEERVGPLIDHYWERYTEVVQSRGKKKQGAVELVGLIGVIPNDPFVVYLPLGARVAYHLSDSWAVEGSFAYNLSLDTGLQEDLEQGGLSPEAMASERQLFRGGVSALWSPAYGKLALGGSVLFFDGYLLGGAGVVRTTEERRLSIPAAVRPDGHLGVGLRAFLGARGVLRLEYRQYLFMRPADGAGNASLGLASEVSLSGGLLLGGTR